MARHLVGNTDRGASHYAVTTIPLLPYHLSSKTFSLYFSLSVRDQVSHPY